MPPDLSPTNPDPNHNHHPDSRITAFIAEASAYLSAHRDQLPPSPSPSPPAPSSPTSSAASSSSYASSTPITTGTHHPSTTITSPSYIVTTIPSTLHIPLPLPALPNRVFSLAVPPDNSPARATALLNLVLSGLKTGITTYDPAPVLLSRSLPKSFPDESARRSPGGFSVILDGAGNPAAVIRTLVVSMCRFRYVGVEFALSEGEGRYEDYVERSRRYIRYMEAHSEWAGKGETGEKGGGEDTDRVGGNDRGLSRNKNGAREARQRGSANEARQRGSANEARQRGSANDVDAGADTEGDEWVLCERFEVVYPRVEYPTPPTDPTDPSDPAIPTSNSESEF